MPLPLLRRPKSSPPRPAKGSTPGPSLVTHLTPTLLLLAMLASGCGGSASKSNDGNNAEGGAPKHESSQASLSLARPVEQNICVSMEGNGENFSSHFGGFIALLERGLNPIVVAGGSSGAPVSAIIRMLMQNPSVPSPQAASQILAASVTVFQNLLFLPSLNDILTTSASFAVNFAAQRARLGFVSNPDYSFAHAEAITSQLLMAAQYFGQTDFTPLLQEPEFHQRVALSKQLYIRTLDMLRVTPEDLISALLTPNHQASSPTAAARNQEIRRRYFLLFQSNIPREASKTAHDMWQEYERRLQRFGFLTNDEVRSRANEIYRQSLPKIRTLPFVGALAATIGKPFLLPSPEVLSNALEGKDHNGDLIPIPAGTIIHTTTRRGEVRRASPLENQIFKRRIYSDIVQPGPHERIDDAPGFENLYQFYFADDEIVRDLRDAQQRNKGYLLYSRNDNGELETPLARPENAQALGGLTLQQAVTASVSEPGVFRRIPLAMRTLKAEGGTPLPPELQDPNAYVITYGGWLDTSANNTLSLLKSCAPDKVGHYVYFHPHRLTNEFQKDALTDLNNRARPEQIQDIQKLLAGIGNYLTRSRARDALRPSINFDWDWDHPIKDDPHLNLELKQSRPLYMHAAYDAFRTILENMGPSVGTSEFEAVSSASPFGETDPDVIADLLSGKSESEIIEGIYGKDL